MKPRGGPAKDPIKIPKKNDVCLRCGCIRMSALPYNGSWSTPVCHCVDSHGNQN